MAKVIPEIFISNVDLTELLGSPEACSEGLTDNEMLQHAPDEGEILNNKDELFSDLEISSTEEEVTPFRPVEVLSSDFNIGNTSEKLINVHSPGKTQKSFTYFLKVSEIDKMEDCFTDYEGVSASEDEEELISVFPQISLSATTDENTDIKEHLVTRPIISPCVTPDPIVNKNQLAQCPMQAHTDTEFIYSDNDVPFRKRIRNGRSLFDGFLSDAEDSDTSLSDNPFMVTRKASLPYSKVNQSKLSVNIRKKSESNLTDIEYIDGFNTKGKSKPGKQQKVKNSLIGKKNIPTIKRNSDKQKKMKCKNLIESNFSYLQVKSEHEGNTDIEEFDEEGIESDIDIETPVYIPETKSHIVISNQNSKGDVALIIPINKPSGSRLSTMESKECGFSDVEELQDYGAEETAILCPSPDPPIFESSFVQASEALKENSKLNPTMEVCEPLTDTEEININKTRRSKKNYKKRQNQISNMKPEEIHESMTDVEDLVMEKHDNVIESQHLASSLINTDIEDFSDDEMNEEKMYLDFDIISSCNVIRAKENLGPFSPDMRLKMNKSIIVPLIKTISPSPIPYNTEMEDMSGEEDITSFIQSDDCNLEPHSSTVHIRHSRMFKPKRDELKEFLQQSDPLTDVEEIEVKEPGSNKWNRKKERKETAIAQTTKAAVVADTKIKMEIERCESAYENLGGFYHEMKEGSLYPPHMGYSEFTTSSSSLGFETETFSELFFSSSSSSSDEDLPSLLGPETQGILYKISRQLDKVPRYISIRQHAEEREDFLDVSDDTEDLINLQSSVENMIEKISREEKLFFCNHSDCLVPNKINKFEKKNNLVHNSDTSDPVQSLSLIENQISNLIKEVEKEEEEILKKIKNKSESGAIVNPICNDLYSSSSDSSDDFEIPRINLKVRRSFGTSTIDIRTSGGLLKRRPINRSLPNMSEHFSIPASDLFQNGQIYPSSSIEYITPKKGLGFVNSGYCIWTSDEDLLEEEGSLEPTVEGKLSEIHTEVISQNGTTINTENILKTDIIQSTDVHQRNQITYAKDDATFDSTEIVKKYITDDQDIPSVDSSNKLTNSQNITGSSVIVPIKDRCNEEFAELPKELSSEFKHAVVEEIKGMEYVTAIPVQSVPSEQNVDQIIKQMESQLKNSNMLSEETESDTEDSPRPIITTPSMSRRGLGGSQRLSQGERPTVRIVTDFAEDSSEEEEEETPYFVTEPIDKPKRRNVKFRFDSGDYRDDEESDREGEEKVKAAGVEKKSETMVSKESGLENSEVEFQKIVYHLPAEEMTKTHKDVKEADCEGEKTKAAKVEKKFERMTSETKESDLEKSDGEFQKMVSQFSVEEMDEALNLWDKGGLTPSDLDSKSLTEPSDETSPQEGTQALEEEDTKEAPQPIPSPRSQSIPSDPPQEEEEELQNYVSKKMFWEQVSHGSVDKQPELIPEKPPVPKPRLSITASIEKPDYYDTSPKGEVLEIEKKSILPEATPTVSVARGISKEESLDDSEIEYIQTHKDELSYDNDAFDMDDTIDSITGILIKKKPIFERSVSLPCDTSSDTSNVRKKKRMFEAQIKKEMVVEQLMAQLEEESSPEHKCIEQKSDKPITDTQAMVARQIHTDIFSDELDQQIDSLVPENKELRLISTKEKEVDSEIILPQTSSPDTSVSSSVAEVLQYKNEVISKPSDSLEVHVDKSEIEGTEKELDEDLKVFEDTKLQAPFSKEKEKIGSVTSSQGESEDTFSESDVTPEDTRFKEQQDIQDWATQELKSDKKTRNIYTPEEHLPDTVWEVPVQETTESLQEETVQQLPCQMLLNASKKTLTELEARVLAQEIVEDIEVEICKREANLFDKKHKAGEVDVPQLKQDGTFHIKFGRTDTTTSSMEITDEDLRSSGVESDISPLESQACQVFKDDLSEGDSSEDVENIDLSKETPGEDVLERTLAEVKESLEAVKEELIEEKKKKKDSITKESPSEFEFKVLSLENRFNESIKESHYEEGTVVSDSEKPKQVAYKDKDDLEKSFDSGTKSEVIIKHDQFDVSMVKVEEKGVQEQECLTKETVIKAEEVEIQQGMPVLKESQAFALKTEEQSTSGLQKIEEIKTLASNAASTSTDLTEESKKTTKSSESYNYSTHLMGEDEHKKFQEHEHKEERKISVEESNKKTDIHSSELLSEDGTVIVKRTEKSETSTLIKSETKHFTEKSTVEEIHHVLSDFGIEDTIYDSEQKEDNSSDVIKSPIQDDLSTSSSSEVKASSDTSIGVEKPSIIIRKHSKSKVSKLHGDVLSDPYSSSGESHYHSFEQTSESQRTPGSRPLSSDIEGLVANLAGITGSSEYESAVSGQSTTVTSRDFQTAASSLSSRDSMKSLDSESSGNLASMEVSSEASETLVPSAMEYEEMENKTPQPLYRIESPLKVQSISESNGQSVSFDFSTEEISEDEVEVPLQDSTQRMKRSHEMTFQPEPRPIVDEKLSSSVDDTGSIVSDSIAQRTVMELSRTESEKMDGSATSDLLTVSGTSDQLSLSESKDTESTKETKIEALSSEFSQQIREKKSVKVSLEEQSVQNVSTHPISRSATHSNGPTQVDYNVEYDEVETEVKKRPGHRRNGSTSFRASMIPVFQGYDFEKKSEDIQEDSAESDKYAQCLTSKEGSQEEKKDVDEAEKPEDECYQTEADQAFHRDIREGRVTVRDSYEYEEIKESGAKSRLSSVAFSEDRPDSELAELLKQCSTDATEDLIERPKTPEPTEECELKDDTPEFSSEAQASVTELEMEYSGAFSRSSEYEAHVSPIREKLWQEEAELAEAEAAAAYHGPHFTSLHETIHEDPIAEKHELETHELSLKEELFDRTSPVPGITVTQHMTPVLDDSFVFPDVDEGSVQQIAESVSSRASSETSLAGKEYVLETATTKSIISDDFVDETSHTTDEKTVFEKDTSKDIESASDSPTSDSFELLEKPDLADEFVIIEEVGKEAEEQDNEGKSVKIVGKRIPYSHRPPEKEIVSPPKTSAKMTKIKYYTKGGEEEEPFEFESGTPPKGVDDKTEESSQEGSPPSAADDDFKPEVEAGKKWMEMQFRGVEPVAPIYGYDMEFERGPLEDIKEEDLNDLESSSKIGSMGSQVSHSIGSFGSVKESLSSTPDYDVLAGRRFFTRSGEHDDVSMSSLQEFERLENLIALESTKHKSLGSQDSLTSSSNSRKHGSKSGGDDISIASLKEFEGLESACIAAERIEKKAKAEEESLLSEIEEGHESQASESESCVTVSVSGVNRDSDEEDYEKRMFEIDEIIRQAQTNVEQFMDAKGKEIDKKLKSESLGHADSLEEMTKVPDLDFDQPVSQSKTYCGKTYITQWEDIGEELLTSTDSLELKTQISKASLADPFTTSTDSLEIKFSQDVMSVSTDSIEAAQKKKAIMTDSIEIGEKSSMITSTDSLEEKVTQANSLDEEEHQVHSSSSGKEVDWSGSGKEESYEGSINRMPPPRAEYMLGSTDSLEPTSSTATHATYQYETDSVMSSSFTSGDSTTMVDDEGIEARAGIWFEEGKPYVTEVIEPGDDEFSQIIHRTVEMPPQITKVSFKGQEAEKALREYIEKFNPGEDISETRDVDASGNVHIKRVIQKRVVIRPEEMGGETVELKGEELEKYLKTLTQSQFPDPSFSDSTDTHAQYSSQWTVSQPQGEKIKSELEEKQISDSYQRGGRPPLKYDISVDEEPEFDPREHDWRFNLHTHLEHDEDHSDGSDGYSVEQKGPSQRETLKK